MSEKYIVTAAVRINEKDVFLGVRHYDQFMRDSIRNTYIDMNPDTFHKYKKEQGFVDQFGTFYDRREAMIIAKESKQKIDFERNGSNDSLLYSEGLY